MPDKMTFVVDPSIIGPRHKVTPHAGETLRGVVKETWLRGERVYGNGQHVASPRGQWLKA
jgi:allantoinase